MRDYDVVIVGAGTTGCVIGEALARRGIKVLCIEAGGRGGFQGPLSLAGDGGIEGVRPSHILDSTLGSFYGYKMFNGLGGMGQYYAGWTYRYRPNDLRLRTLYGVGADWPIEYAELLRWYQAAEALMGVCGEPDPGVPGQPPYPMPAFPVDYATQVFNRRTGGRLPFSPAPQSRNRQAWDGRPACLGYRQCWLGCPNEAKWTPQNSVLKRSGATPGLEFLLRAPVVFIEAGPGGDITGVRCLTRTGEVRITARSFVLAANGVENPRLLLHCRQPHAPDGLGNRSGQVGRNYLGHPEAHWVVDLGEPVFGGRGPLHSSHCTMFTDHPERAQASAFNLNSIETALPPVTIDPALWGADLVRKAQESGTTVRLTVSYEMLPDPANYIDLGPQTDALGLSLARIHYNLTDYGRRGVERSRRLIEPLLKASGITHYDLPEPHGDGAHWMGATRMGFNKDDSVADSHGRVWDHPNLYIAGASLYPTSTTFNPIETSVALALRTAAKIAETVQPGAG